MVRAPACCSFLFLFGFPSVGKRIKRCLRRTVICQVLSPSGSPVHKEHLTLHGENASQTSTSSPDAAKHFTNRDLESRGRDVSARTHPCCQKEQKQLLNSLPTIPVSTFIIHTGRPFNSHSTWKSITFAAHLGSWSSKSKIGQEGYF